MWSKPLAVPNGVNAGEAEQSGHEETSRTGTESEHEAHAQGRVPGRDGAGGAVARTHRVDRSGLAGSEHGASALCARDHRSEEHTSELQSLMRISYAVFCLKKKNNFNQPIHST